MVVAVCRLSLHFPQSRSLKSKRQGLRRILDRARAKFNVAIAEVGEQDTWQRARVGFAVVSSSGDHAQSMVDTICNFVAELYVAQVLDREVDILQYGDERIDDQGVWTDEDEARFGGDGGGAA
ncbi:MAG: DUF503 domain-containing protein [Myxococcales bacterium]|nr:DUF503 domain-containing protein [Myxococcales bacterium]